MKEEAYLHVNNSQPARFQAKHPENPASFEGTVQVMYSSDNSTTQHCTQNSTTDIIMDLCGCVICMCKLAFH